MHGPVKPWWVEITRIVPVDTMPTNATIEATGKRILFLVKEKYSLAAAANISGRLDKARTIWVINNMVMIR